MKQEVIIGKNIKSYRERMKLTQNDLAEYLSIKREMISYYEGGSRTIPMEHLEKLSDLFGVDVLDIMEENPEANAVNLAFAFRADELTPEDLESVSNFKKIVKNYLKIGEMGRNVSDRTVNC